MEKGSKITKYLIANIFFYFSIINMIILDYLKYDDYLWGILTLVMIISFIGSLTSDLLANLGYEINTRYSAFSIINKIISLIIFLGIWSYLNNLYKIIALFIFGIIFIIDILLFTKIHKQINNLNIKFKDVINKLDETKIDDKAEIYKELYKSLIGSIIYISFPKVNLVSNILAIIIMLVFQFKVIKELKLKLSKNYLDKNKEINKILCIFSFNIILIIIFSIINIKIFFICMIIGLNWVIISDSIYKKKTSFKIINIDKNEDSF